MRLATHTGVYDVERTLGSGGMGHVYLARDAGGLRVALKRLHAHLEDDSTARARFEREANAIAAVRHPNVVAVLDVGVHEDSPFFVMEMVDGEALSAAMARDAPLPIDRAVHIACDVLAGLGAVHDAGVVHRDLKPDNVLLVGQGANEVAKVFDFGLAAFVEGAPDLTPLGRAMGTPAYASPEQLLGSGARDRRSDLFSLAVVLYEMLCGHAPFHAASFTELCDRVLGEEPAPIAAFRKDVPAHIAAVLARGLAKDPGDRFIDAASMRRALMCA